MTLNIKVTENGAVRVYSGGEGVGVIRRDSKGEFYSDDILGRMDLTGARTVTSALKSIAEFREINKHKIRTAHMYCEEDI